MTTLLYRNQDKHITVYNGINLYSFLILAPLSPLSGVLAQGPRTVVSSIIFGYLEYLHKGLNHRSSLVILSTWAKS